MSFCIKYSKRAVNIPSPTNNHLIANAPIIGVMINGNNEMNITGPFIDRVKLFTVKAISNPKNITNGKVIKQNEIVNLKAFQKFIFSISLSDKLYTAFLNLLI